MTFIKGVWNRTWIVISKILASIMNILLFIVISPFQVNDREDLDSVYVLRVVDIFDSFIGLNFMVQLIYWTFHGFFDQEFFILSLIGSILFPAHFYLKYYIYSYGLPDIIMETILVGSTLLIGTFYPIYVVKIICMRQIILNKAIIVKKLICSEINFEKIKPNILGVDIDLTPLNFAINVFIAADILNIGFRDIVVTLAVVLTNLMFITITFMYLILCLLVWCIDRVVKYVDTNFDSIVAWIALIWEYIMYVVDGPVQVFI